MPFETLSQADAQFGAVLPQAFLQVEQDSDELFDRPTLELAFSRFGREANIGSQIVFRIVTEGKPRPLDPLIKREAFRIGREALLNAFQHSRARAVELQLGYVHSGLRIAVRYNGRRISAEVVRKRCAGLSWMQNLAERIGAKLKMLTRVGAGTEVFLSIPAHIAFVSREHFVDIKSVASRMRQHEL